jgi:DNA-binding MarR family transcriptional regulator
MNRGDLADLTAFVAVADQLSFRAAASRLGVTPSALSHCMRQLEERLGMRLLNRTTRSVSVTDAGLRLLERLRSAIDQIAGALEDLNQERQRPIGRLADLCEPCGGCGGHRTDLRMLLVGVPGCPLGARGGRGDDRHRVEGIRRRNRPPRPGAGRHDCHRLCCNVKDDAHRAKHLMPIVARFRIGGMLDIIRLHALLSD